ncbi:hypothetical protein C7M84_005205, partial [Penaeus vannamei]
EGPCLDELYVEGCPTYVFRVVRLAVMNTTRNVFIEPKGSSVITFRGERFHESVRISTRRQIRLWKNGSESCMDVSGLQPMKWRSSKNYLEIQSSKPLWFSFDCINASHSCRFHRLIKVVFVPGENGLVTWRPEGQAFKLEAGIRAYGRVDYIEPGKRSYDIAIHGSSAGPLCGISCPSLNLNFMSAAYCGHPMVIISVNKTRFLHGVTSTSLPWSLRHTASGPPEDVPTALASPSSISTVDGDKTSKTFPLLVCAREGMLRRPAKVSLVLNVTWVAGKTQLRCVDGQGYLRF